MINKYYLLFVLFCEINLFKHNDSTIKYFLSVSTFNNKYNYLFT